MYYHNQKDLKAPQMHMQVIYFWYVLMRHELNKFKFIGVTVSNRIFVLIITYNNNLVNVWC